MTTDTRPFEEMNAIAKQIKEQALVLFVLDVKLLSDLFELRDGSFYVLTPGTFDGSQIEARLLRLNARQIHLRCAFRAVWTRDNRRVFKCIF